MIEKQIPEYGDIDAGTQMIVEMANIPSEREKLVSALAKNGVRIDFNAPNDELYTAVFTAITESKSFRTDLKKAVFSFLQTRPQPKEFDDDGFFNLSDEEKLRIFQQAGSTVGKQVAQTTNSAAGVTQPKSGGFFSGLLTKENAAQLANFGINFLSNKLTQKADQQSVQQGITYQVAKANTAELERKREEAKKKWVVPVIIASSLVAVAIIGFVIYKNRKK
jgi:hypothetical protein